MDYSSEVSRYLCISMGLSKSVFWQFPFSRIVLFFIDKSDRSCGSLNFQKTKLSTLAPKKSI